MAINIQKLVDAINAKNLSLPASTAPALTEPVGEAADVFVGGIAITEYDLDTIPAGTTVTYDNSRWLATDFTANPAGNTSGDDILLGTWPSSETAAVVIDFNNTYIEMNNIVYSSNIKIAFSILRGANNVTIKNLNLKIKGTSATWTGIHASDAYGNATATVTFENCVFDLSEWVKGASPGAYPNSYVYLNGQSLVFDADCIVIKSPSHGDVFSPYINRGTIDATNATVYTSTDAEAIALLPLSKSLTGISLGGNAERLTINKLISNINSAYDIYTTVDSVSDLPESTAANHGLLTYIRGSNAFYVSNAFIGWEPLSIGGAGAVVPYGVVYPLSSTTADPTNTTWRTTYGTPVGYQWVADFGMVTTSPLTNMTGMFEGNTSFNDPDIATWDVSTVTNMSSVFKDASNFGSEIELLQTLDNPSGQAQDYFGRGPGEQCVDISETYTIVGSAYEPDAVSTGSGKAYVFNNATGALVLTLNNPNPFASTGTTSLNDNFGSGVAITDTYIAVGAPNQQNNSVTNSGKVYIYNIAGALIRTIDNPSAATNNDSFGQTLKISGNFLIIGGYRFDDGNGADQGKAFVYDVTTGVLQRQFNCPAANVSLFGWSVDILGDYALIGAVAGTAGGTTYLYNWSTGGLVNVIPNPGAVAQSGFGNNVSICSDYVMISASGSVAKKVYIYDRSAMGAPLHTITNNSTYAVAITNDYAIASASNAGLIYIYSTVTGTLLHTLVNPNPDGVDFSTDEFGKSLSVSEDGRYLIASAPNEDVGAATNVGKAYIYDLTPASWSISGWNTTSVTNMNSMFQNASVFDQDLSAWVTTSVTDMDNMFQNAAAFDQNLNAWDVLAASVAPGNSTPPTDFDTGTAGAWTTAEKPLWGTIGGILYPLTNTATDPTSATWRTANPTYQFIANVGIVMPTGSPITDMGLMFYDNATFNDPDISTWDVSTVTNMHGVFTALAGTVTTFNQDISSWNVSGVTGAATGTNSMNRMFQYADAFNNGGATFVGSTFVSTMGGVTDMYGMFQDAPAFNQDISSWNVSSVTNMAYMFYSISGSVFNQDISSWNVSSVTEMQDMFNGASVFDQDISGWDVTAASVAPGNSTPPTSFDLNTNASWTTAEKPVWGAEFGNQTYSYALTLATDPTSASWTTKPAGYTYYSNQGIGADAPITDMSSMFYNAATFNDTGTTSWDTSTVTNMDGMFNGAAAFTQDISGWDVSNIPSLPTSFGANTSANWTIDRKPSWGTTGMIHDATFGKMVAMFDIQEGTPTLHNGSLHTQTSAVGYDILTDFGTVLDDARYSAAIANATKISILIHDISQPANFATGMAYVGSAIFNSAQVTEVLATSPVPWPSTTLTKIGTSFETNNINGQLYKSGPQIGGSWNGLYSFYYTYDATPATGGYWPQALTRAYMPIYAGLDPGSNNPAVPGGGVNASLFYNTFGRLWYGWHGTNKDVMTLWIQ